MRLPTAWNAVETGTQSTADFLRKLFQLLSEFGVRYCVIHSWERLPEHLGSDLDLAVHPADKKQITSIIEALKSSNYSAYQWSNYITHGHSFYFYWVAGGEVNTVPVDIIFEDRRAGMIMASGEDFVAGRVRHGDFWVASPAMEFSYLLVKKANKGKVSSAQTLRLKRLAESLGRESAEKIVSNVFRADLKTRIVEACLDGSIDEVFGDLKGEAWQTAPSKRLLKTIRYWAGQFRRAIWRTSHPSGISDLSFRPRRSGKEHGAGRSRRGIQRSPAPPLSFSLASTSACQAQRQSPRHRSPRPVAARIPGFNGLSLRVLR